MVLFVKTGFYTEYGVTTSHFAEQSRTYRQTNYEGLTIKVQRLTQKKTHTYNPKKN